MSTILDLQNITTTVNVGTNEEKNILKNIFLCIEENSIIEYCFTTTEIY